MPTSPNHRWLFVLPNLDGGGAQRVCVNIANELVRRGWRVHFALFDVRGELRRELDPEIGVERLRVDSIRGAAARLRELFRSWKPDICLSTMVIANLVACAARRPGAGPLFIVREANTLSHWLRERGGGLRNALLRLRIRRLYRRADCLLANSAGSADDLARHAGVPRRRVSVVGNALDLDRIRALAAEPPGVDLPAPPPGTVRVVAAGRLARHKDFATAIGACAALREARPIQLVILGEGPARRELEAHARGLGVADLVHLPGHIANPCPIIAGAGAFLLSSRWEGAPNVLIEALALGVPVVATDCPNGPREILDDGRLGRLVPVGDAEAMAAALRATLAEEADRDALRTRAEAFAVHRVVDNLLAQCKIPASLSEPRNGRDSPWPTTER